MNANEITIDINCLSHEQLDQLKEMIYTCFKIGGDCEWASKIKQCNDRQFEIEN